MKKLFFILIVASIGLHSCNESDFEENYPDPSKIAASTVDKQFSGFLQTNKDYVLKAYLNYFVVLRTTLSRWTQATGWTNATNQYVPGESTISNRWDNYYSLLTQYRELEKIYNALEPEDQERNEIYMLTAAVYLYDHTQKVVDLHGDIPFSEAGRLSQNGGDYIASLPAYDTAEAIYTFMLDDLLRIADRLNSINVNPGIQTGFNTQDFVNNGSIDLWKKYCNSLRLRMLTRVSGVSEFQSRSQSEINAILTNPGAYPVVENNSENIQIDVVSLDTPIHSKGFRTGLEDWDGNVAGQKMIDHMLGNNDPRLRAMYEPGEEAGGVYQGIDPLANETVQSAMISDGTVSIYNRSTLSRNEYFPGVLITAAEVSYLKSEAYLNAGNDAMAQSNYETGIQQSIDYYYLLRTLSQDEVSGPLTPLGATEIDDYIATAGVNWGGAVTTDDKLNLLGTQKWIHYSVVQLPESWAEVRRLNQPGFNFFVDTANPQQLPPDRWKYPSGERVNNEENYAAVSADDNLTTKIFWDVN
ncbi:SusD/RagB family nutrient-binding outer membrane lipoprotein [Flagellimonas sp.]|uniref:SusD/RagB family nutrient-binding outer membrane lipoprotein n=1 Tax=Flagellimonas sp. TaxID=2058762 RepID=UPI003B5062C0